ncbi:aspartate aminotransferase family protein [Fluviispira multicolorata]|nr:aspartate aminotransferase family protein [Fluviispira multicolorata]
MTKIHARKQTDKFLSRLQQVECPDTTFFADRFPIVMKRGNGMWIRDVDNNRYLDFTACFAVLALGHRPKTSLTAIRKQAASLLHGMGDVHPTLAKIKLLELLAEISPFENAKSLLGQSGGDAIESAMKTAMLATGRKRFLSFSGGYHGLQFAPLVLNDREDFTRGFESWISGKTVTLPFPYFKSDLSSNQNHLTKDYLWTEHKLEQPEIVLQQMEDELKKKEFAALIMEPFQGRGGKRGFSADFVKSCKELCKKYGTLLVFDEIYTGFGRTGKMFAYEHYNVIPDLLCVGKAMGGGLPISACVGEILDVWGKSKGEARQTQTFLGNPLACAVAYETIKEIQNKLPLFQKELVQIDFIFQKFISFMQKNGLSDRFPFEIRGKGFMRGVWFYTQKEGFAVPMMEILLELGYIVLPEGPRADVLSLTPPLIAKSEHFEKILNALQSELKKM